ncbi:NPCBM/NEW2 domain-containing protein [Streptomyces sp. NPDC049040]|uniref:NPCBM/NEW2 domain-containing protein n=1 Tax=Streptomyces sp. NPDC049040 TaxID=3365593 RepID=UPI00371C57ED
MTIQPESGETPPSRDSSPPRPSTPPPPPTGAPTAPQPSPSAAPPRPSPPAGPPANPSAGPPARPKRDLSGIASLVNAGIGVAALVVGFFGGAGVQATAGGPFPGPATTVTVTSTATPTTTVQDSTPPPSPSATSDGRKTTSTVALNTLAPVSGPFASADTTPSLDGQPQAQAIVQDLGCVPAGDAQYNLGRDYTRLTAQVGLDDNSQDAKVAPTLTIVGDGRQLLTVLPKFGASSPLDVDVTGVIRLEIKWSYQRPPQTPNPIVCTPNAQLVIADGQLTQAAA